MIARIDDDDGVEDGVEDGVYLTGEQAEKIMDDIIDCLDGEFGDGYTEDHEDMFDVLIYLVAKGKIRIL